MYMRMHVISPKRSGPTPIPPRVALILFICGLCLTLMGLLHVEYRQQAEGHIGTLGWLIGRFMVSGRQASTALPRPRQDKQWGNSTWVEKCDDSCSHALNGVCDEGRGDTYTSTPVYCDLGTDCSDCGRWQGRVSQAWSEGGPISHIMSMNSSKPIKLFTKTTITKPPFKMLFTDPSLDLDVSAALHDHGVIEAGISVIFRTVLHDQCFDPITGERKYVLDIGANFGYFSVYAAMMGCRVLAWEPVPHFRAFLSQSLALNNVTDLVSIRDKVVAPGETETIDMQVPSLGVWGTASVMGINQFVSQKATSVTVSTEGVDAVIAELGLETEDVLIMKVDVEGYEPFVFQSAANLLASGKVQNVVLEYNPGVAERTPRTVHSLMHLITDNPKMLQGLISLGYDLGLMFDEVAKGYPAMLKFPLPVLPRMTLEQLELDLKDATAFREHHDNRINHKVNPTDHFNCTAKKQLGRLNHRWYGCPSMPEDAHPKSARSAFTYNANIWAQRTATAHLRHRMRLQSSTCGVLAMHEPDTQWTSRSDISVAHKNCFVIPAGEIVRNRCPCSVAERRQMKLEQVNRCKAEANLFEELFIRGTKAKTKGLATSQAVSVHRMQRP